MLWHMLLLQNLSVTVVNLYVDIYKASETLHLKASFRAYQSLLASIVFLLAFTLQLLDKLYYRPLLWRPTMLSSLTNFYVFTLIEWTFYHDLFLTALYWTTLTMKKARWSSGRASDFRSRGPGFKTTCGRASDFSVEGTGVQNHLLPFQNLGNFVHPTLPVSIGRDTKSRWSLLPGVYARGSKRSHTGGKSVTCRGLNEWWSLSLTHQF